MTTPAPLIRILKRRNLEDRPKGLFIDSFDTAQKFVNAMRSRDDITTTLIDEVGGGYALRAEGTLFEGATAREGQWLILDGSRFRALDEAQAIAEYEIDLEAEATVIGGGL